MSERLDRQARMIRADRENVKFPQMETFKATTGIEPVEGAYRVEGGKCPD